MDTDKLETVAAKIKKLLALGKSPNEHEAAAAIAKAQELCATYNLNMAQVEASGKAPQTTEDTGQKRTKTAMKSKAMYKWQQRLAHYVADVNFCMHFIQESGEWRGGRYVKTPTHVFIGREASVVTAQLMYEYLCQAIERLVPIANNAERLSRSAMSWKEGCADRLCERLLNQKADTIRRQEESVRAAQASGGTGLVLASQYAASEDDLNRDFLYGYEPGTIARQRAESDARWAALREARANAVQAPVEPQPVLTPKEQAAQERQRAKDEERQRKEHQRWQERENARQERENARQERENARKDWAAYHAGARAGSNIGLDAQVGKKG